MELRKADLALVSISVSKQSRSCKVCKCFIARNYPALRIDNYGSVVTICLNCLEYFAAKGRDAVKSPIQQELDL